MQSILAATKKKAFQRKATIAWLDAEPDIDHYLNQNGAENWRSAFVPLVQGTMLQQGEQWATELGMQFDVRNLEGEVWFDNYMLRFAEPINQTTSDDIHGMLAQAQAEGWSHEQMTSRLDQLFDQYTKGNVSAEDMAWLDRRRPPFRREMIARTETMRASNAGAYNLLGRWGVEWKEWLATHDDRTRDTHIAAGREYSGRGAIPMNEPFKVGGYDMMYPGDSGNGAPPREFINCRCTVLPVLDAPEKTNAPDSGLVPGQIGTMSPNYTPQTFEDWRAVDEHLRQLGLDRKGIRDLSIRQRTAVANQLTVLNERFPGVIGSRNLRMVTGSVDDMYHKNAKAEMGSDGEMSFHPGHFGPNDNAGKQRGGRYWTWDEALPQEYAHEVITTHEFGHAVDFYLQNQRDTMVDYWFGDPAMPLSDAWLEWKTQFNHQTDSPTNYGRTNQTEMIAEAFAEMQHTDPASWSQVADSLHRFLTETGVAAY